MASPCCAYRVCGGPVGALGTAAYLSIAVYPLAFALFPPGSLRGGNAGGG
jgi:hypothetical protein